MIPASSRIESWLCAAFQRISPPAPSTLLLLPIRGWFLAGVGGKATRRLLQANVAGAAAATDVCCRWTTANADAICVWLRLTLVVACIRFVQFSDVLNAQRDAQLLTWIFTLLRRGCARTIYSYFHRPRALPLLCRTVICDMAGGAFLPGSSLC